MELQMTDLFFKDTRHQPGMNPVFCKTGFLGLVEEGKDDMTTTIRKVGEEMGLQLQDLWLYEDLKSEVKYRVSADIKIHFYTNILQNYLQSTRTTTRFK